MTRRCALFATLAAAAMLVLAACGGSAGSGGGNSDPIKVGAWIPLSGAIAATGEPVRTGTDVFFKQLAANGGIDGRTVEWIAQDNAYDPQQTVRVARELVGRDGVVAILGSLGTAQTEAAFPYVLEQQKVPVVGNYGGTAAWYDPPRPGLFGFQTPYEEQAAVLGRWAAEDGAGSVLVVHSDPAAYANVANSVAKGAPTGTTVDTLPVRIGTTDYAPVLAEVKKRAPAAVVLIMPVDEASAYLKERALQNVIAPTYGYSVHAANALLDLAGPAAEGYHTLSWVRPPTSDDPAVVEYRTALETYAPGQKPDFPSLLMYGAAKAFGQIVGTIDGPVTAESVTAAYERASAVETGILPPLTFGPQQHLGTHEVLRLIVRGGEFATQGDFVSAQG
ncbi:ABC transporter substrate-binding protein [Pseudonocardia halophobica]|uniref:ABC transporter substrate-binding protein n=1 Tax=Pseudonocardia halophobica TaxID=29401 RepID=UPI003D89C390